MEPIILSLLLAGLGASMAFIGSSGDDHLEDDDATEEGSEVVENGNNGNGESDGGEEIDDDDDDDQEYPIDPLNTIIGTGMDDQIYSKTENVEIWGLGGADDIRGSEGNDYLIGDNSRSGVDDDGFDGHDYIDGLRGDDHILGNGGDDTLLGGDGDDSIFGNHGDDHIYGGDGSDYLSGGSGNNILFGGEGGDTILTAEGSKNSIDSGPGDNTLHLAGRDTVVGGKGSNNYILYPSGGGLIEIQNFHKDRDSLEIDVTALNGENFSASVRGNDISTSYFINDVELVRILGRPDLTLEDIAIVRSLGL